MKHPVTKEIHIVKNNAKFFYSQKIVKKVILKQLEYKPKKLETLET
jgi:hypothetical protein